MNLIINLENDDWILDDMTRTMAEYGARESSHLPTAQEEKISADIDLFTTVLVNETEYSLFSREAYDTFKANPTVSLCRVYVRDATAGCSLISRFLNVDPLGLGGQREL